MIADQEIERRRREVLTAVVRQYISTGQPVGSKWVARQLREPLSSATVRSIMVELEEAGLLGQPHASAGRTPTYKAYRFYVDRVLGSMPLELAVREYIDRSLKEEVSELDRLMAKTPRVLSEVSHNVGLVLGPPLEEKVLEHVKFIRLPERRVLAVIVSKPDVVENRVVRLDEGVSQDELDDSANYLNAEFRGWSLRAIRVEVFKRVEAMRALCDRLISNLATLFREGALAGDETAPLFLDGTARILEKPEFEDVRRVKELLSALEQKARLVNILNSCVQMRGNDVRILIGEENPDAQMKQCTFILAPFYYQDRALGLVGILGPTRMEYDRAINAVQYVARLCSRQLSAN